MLLLLPSACRSYFVPTVDEDDFLVLLSENAAHQIYTKWVDTLEVTGVRG